MRLYSKEIREKLIARMLPSHITGAKWRVTTCLKATTAVDRQLLSGEKNLANLIETAVLREQLQGKSLVLHSDNDTPMKGRSSSGWAFAPPIVAQR